MSPRSRGGQKYPEFKSYGRPKDSLLLCLIGCYIIKRMEQRCTNCKKTLPLEAFRSLRQTNKPTRCCQNCREQRRQISADVYHGRRQRRTTKGRPPKTLEELSKSHLLLSSAARTYREEKTAAQNGLCAICGKKRKLDLDHCHKHNRFRGMLCRACNQGLGMFQDSSALLQKAINYLVAHNFDH